MKKFYAIKILIIIVIIIIAVGLLYYIKDKKNEPQKNDNYTPLEKIALEDFIKTLDTSYFISDFEDHETIKIRYAINKYIEKYPEEVLPEAIAIFYNNIFAESNITVEEISNEIISQNIMHFDTETQTYQKTENEIKNYNTRLNPFVAIKEIKKIDDEKFKLVLDIVQNIDIEKLINYYENQAENSHDILGINIELLYDYRETEMKGNIEDKNFINLNEYLNEENYASIATEIATITLNIKIEDGEIKIIDFGTL